MRKLFINTLNFSFIILLLNACSASKLVTFQVDESADFTSFKTYSFPAINVEQEQLYRNHRLKMIVEAIDREMRLRGYSKTENSPDLLLNVGVVVEERVQTRETSVRDAQYMGTRNYHWESEEVVVDTYNVGAITMDVVDLTDNKMIWYGVAERVVNEKYDDEKAEKIINETVSVLFKKYPKEAIE